MQNSVHAQNKPPAHAFNSGISENGFFYDCYIRVGDTAYIFSRTSEDGNQKKSEIFLQLLPSEIEQHLLTGLVENENIALVSLLTADTIGRVITKDKNQLVLKLAAGDVETYIHSLPVGEAVYMLPIAGKLLDDNAYISKVIVSGKGSTNDMRKLAGAYSLRDGGVDVGSSTLVLEQDSSFLIIGLGTVITGRWRLSPNNSIVCKEIHPATPFIVVGSHSDDVPRGKRMIDCNNISTAYAQIAFSIDSIRKDTLRRIFNDGANCTGDDYRITVPKDVKFMQLSCPEYDRNHMQLKPVFKGFQAVFPLSESYNFFTIAHNERATSPPATFIISQDNSQFYLDGKPLGKPRILKEKDKLYISQVLAAENAVQKGAPYINSIGQQMGFFIRASYAVRSIIHLSATSSYFVAKCPEDERP